MSMARHVERRTHTKSRKGCVQCKKRHVKCNERRPQCGRCERLEIDCEWPVKKQVEVVKEDSLPVNGVGMGDVPAFGEELNIRDLRLLQFWFLNTSLTCSQPGHHYLWQTSVVDLGFQHHFLLRGVLATAAVHKASIHHEEADELLLQSSQHMDITMAAFREHLTKPDPATCVPVFALACLLVMHRLGLAQVQTPADPIEELCIYARLSRGIKPTCSDYWPRILGSEMGPLIKNVTAKDEIPKSFPEIEALKDLATHHHESYLTAIADLHDAFSNTYNSPQDQGSIGRLFSWMANLSNEFLDGLARREEVSLVVLAYFAVLMREGGRFWYLRNWAGWLLQEVERCVGGEMRAWLEWPRGEILGCGEQR